MIRHVVVWTMKDGRSDELGPLLDELRELPGRIGEIESLSAGTLLNESPHDAVLCVDVSDAAALEAYRGHPAHQPSLRRMRETAAEIVVADYQF